MLEDLKAQIARLAQAEPQEEPSMGSVGKEST
jgi:hypothetical protein